MTDAKEALAESWASIDGRLGKFKEGKGKEHPLSDHYDGYMHEAGTMIERLRKRGYVIVPVEPTAEMLDTGLIRIWNEELYPSRAWENNQITWAAMIKAAEGE